MNEFEIVNIVKRPVEEVFAFVEKAENISMYNPAVREARKTSEGPIGIGSTAVMTGRFLGRDFDTSWETVDYKLNERFEAKTVSGPFHLEILSTFEATTDGGTRITQHCKGDTRGFFKLAEPVVFRITRKQFEASAEALKELLEAGGDASGG